ncbi:MAG: hypothetical protein AB8G23_24090 [Myxococcota bacterium]
MSDRLDQIAEKRRARDDRAAARMPFSSMSDTKWRKALKSLASTNARDICEWKFVADDNPVGGWIPEPNRILERCVEPHCIDAAAGIVPLYKDVEWLELLAKRRSQSYENAPVSISEQNLDSAEAALTQIGQFDLERTPTGLRLYAYRKSDAE